jgi:hypothetical protein
MGLSNTGIMIKSVAKPIYDEPEVEGKEEKEEKEEEINTDDTYNVKNAHCHSHGGHHEEIDSKINKALALALDSKSKDLDEKLGEGLESEKDQKLDTGRSLVERNVLDSELELTKSAIIKLIQ